MKRYLLLIALLGLIVGCQQNEQPNNQETQNQTVEPGKRVLPTSIQVKSIDLTNAAALAVMASSAVPSSVKTKAPEDGQEYRIFIVDTDGNTKLASFTITVDGNQNDPLWENIFQSLSLVPSDIIPYSEEFVMFANVHAVCDFNWQEELSESEEDTEIALQIQSLFEKVSGNYLLRLSDGALFNSPVSVLGNRYYFDDVVKSTSDGKNLVFMPFQMMANVEAIGADAFPVVITDMGDIIQMSTPTQKLLETSVEDYAGFFLTPDNRIIPLVSGDGTWSFSMDLTPSFIDYSARLKSMMSTLSGASRHNYAWQMGDDAYLLYRSSKATLWRVFVNGETIDCEQIGSSSVTFPKYLDEGVVIRKVENGLIVFYEGGISTINVLTGEMAQDKIPSGFPQDPLGYDENGIAYTCDASSIQKFDIKSKTKTDIPINWSTTEFGALVSITYSEFVGGVFTITGLTRTAQTVTVLVDAETGAVTVTDIVNYSGSVVSSYYRLN